MDNLPTPTQDELDKMRLGAVWETEQEYLDSLRKKQLEFVKANQDFENFMPEAEEIIEKNISLLEKERRNIVKKTMNFRKAILTLNPEDWFWSEKYVDYFIGIKIKEIDRKLRQLKFQLFKFALKKNPDTTYISREEQLNIAKSKSLADIAEHYLNQIKFSGNRLTAICPFHKEETPSFVIYIEENRFNCFGCGVHGDVIDFWRKIRDVDFNTALKELSL